MTKPKPISLHYRIIVWLTWPHRRWSSRRGHLHVQKFSEDPELFPFQTLWIFYQSKFSSLANYTYTVYSYLIRPANSTLVLLPSSFFCKASLVTKELLQAAGIDVTIFSSHAGALLSRKLTSVLISSTTSGLYEKFYDLYVYFYVALFQKGQYIIWIMSCFTFMWHAFFREKFRPYSSCLFKAELSLT